MTAEYRAPTTRIGRFREALFLSIRAAGGIQHPSAPDECLLKAPDEVYARVKALRAERDAAIARAEAAEAQVAALTAKVDALCSKGQCGCSWDREGDVCEYHSPKLVAAEAQVAKLREALTAVVKDFDDLIASSAGVTGLHLNGDIARWSDLVGGGRFAEWTEGLRKARAALVGKEPAHD